MTLGTSPHPRGNSVQILGGADGIRAVSARVTAWAKELARAATGPSLARVTAVLYLGGLSILAMTAWHEPSTVGGNGLVAGLPGWHLAFLMAMGTGVAVLTLAKPGASSQTGDENATAQAPNPGLSELMAQMSHELRTPLNAVIGFSELMLRELHGPLGNARYQEYAHHISESGGRLLKSSTEALAVTETMTALMTDRRAAKRARYSTATLLREAWLQATPATEPMANQLDLIATTCDLTCERRPTVQAFEHLFREAMARSGGDATITMTARRKKDHRIVELRVAHGAELGAGGDNPDARSSLRLILAHILLELQGASISCRTGVDGWTASVEFHGQA